MDSHNLPRPHQLPPSSTQSERHQAVPPREEFPSASIEEDSHNIHNMKNYLQLDASNFPSMSTANMHPAQIPHALSSLEKSIHSFMEPFMKVNHLTNLTAQIAFPPTSVLDDLTMVSQAFAKSINTTVQLESLVKNFGL